MAIHCRAVKNSLRGTYVLVVLSCKKVPYPRIHYICYCSFHVLFCSFGHLYVLVLVCYSILHGLALVLVLVSVLILVLVLVLVLIFCALFLFLGKIACLLLLVLTDFT
jgi:hypothetical protein